MKGLAIGEFVIAAVMAAVAVVDGIATGGVAAVVLGPIALLALAVGIGLWRE